MDVDNVVTGNGGKEAYPHDHNRDWNDTPIYPEVAAAQRRLASFIDDGRLSVFLDLHNPAAGDRTPFFFVGPPDLLSDAARGHRDRFLSLAARRIAGEFALKPTPSIAGPGYHPLWRQRSDQWITDRGNPATVAACLETPWNTPHSTTEGYRKVGRQLGRAVADFLADR